MLKVKKMNDTMDEKIKNVSIEDREGLTKDSIAALICLEGELKNIRAAISLIKNRKIVAVYRGDRSEPYDSDKFVLMSKREFEEEKELQKK